MITVLYRNVRSSQLERLEKPRAGSWLYVTSPSEEELERLANEHALDIALLRDAIDPYEAPRIEREGGVVYVFTRYLQPAGTKNATEPLLVIYTPDVVITVMLYEADVLQRLVGGQELVLTTQKTKLLLQILSEVNRSYRLFMNKVSRHIFSIRSQIRKNDLITSKSLISLIDVEDDLTEVLSALQPHEVLLRNLLSGRFLRLYEDDRDLIEDLQLGTGELIDLAKSRMKSLVNLRQTYDAIATNELNKTFRRLTSISIFLMIPTIMAGLYGMNVALPLEDSPLAFWQVLLITLLILAAVITFFRRKRWV